jgi:uncharacterized protein YcaQ
MDSIKARCIKKEEAKRFLIRKQNFLQEKMGKEGTLEAIGRLGCVQTDPISVVHRNQHLVLHNRISDYDVTYLEELLYQDRKVFEYWCNEKSIIPIEDIRYFHYRMKNPSEFHSPYYEHIKRRRAQLRDIIAYVLSEVGKNGPLSANDLADKGKIKNKIATNILNLLWDCGDLMIHHVEFNRRYYDLMEHVLPSITRMETPRKEEFERFIIHKYMEAHGFVDTRDWRFGWLPMKSLLRKAIVKQMVNERELFPVRVEGVKQEFYVLREMLNSLEDSDARVEERILFLAPLDNLLWNRRLISEIFDFDYAWEVYKIPEKRMYGYYVMPILSGTRFIGRIDPKLDRENEKMIINSLTLIEKSANRSVASELAWSLRRFSELHDVSSVAVLRTQPKELKDMLAQELG